MKKLLFILSIIICSSCGSKFDGLQGGMFTKDRVTATFDDDKAYLIVQNNDNNSFYLDFILLEPNPKIIDNFTKLFEKYKKNNSFYSSTKNKSLRYFEINEEMDNKISQSGNDFQQIEFSYWIRYTNNIDLIYDYKRVGQNQILLSKPSNELNYSDYNEFNRELEILINKYESDGYIFGRKTILNIPSFIQSKENDYLKSIYYLNKVEKGYTLKNLEHTFFYYEQR